MALYKEFLLVGSGTTGALAGADLAQKLANTLSLEGFTVKNVSSTTFSLDIQTFGGITKRVNISSSQTLENSLLSCYSIYKTIYKADRTTLAQNNVYDHNSFNALQITQIFTTVPMYNAEVSFRLMNLPDQGMLLIFKNFRTDLFEASYGIHWMKVYPLDPSLAPSWIVGSLFISNGVYSYNYTHDDQSAYLLPNLQGTSFLNKQATKNDGVRIVQTAFFSRNKKQSYWYCEYLLFTSRYTNTLYADQIITGVGPKKYLYARENAYNTTLYELEDR